MALRDTLRACDPREPAQCQSQNFMSSVFRGHKFKEYNTHVISCSNFKGVSNFPLKGLGLEFVGTAVAEKSVTDSTRKIGLALSSLLLSSYAQTNYN